MKQEEQKLNTRRGIVLYDKNPFIIMNFRPSPRRITNKRGDMMLVSAETGEIQTPIAGFWEMEEVDSTKFLKLFVNGVKALAELSNAGTRLFELLYIEIQNNVGKDQVYLSYTGLDEHQKANISQSTFKRGLAELITKRFLAAMPAVGWYWVNPDYIWNGDRLAFFKQYRRVSRKKQLEQDNLTRNLFSEIIPETEQPTEKISVAGV